MEEKKSKTFTMDEIKGVAVEIQPVLESLLSIIKKHGIEGFITASAWDDGRSYLIGDGLKGWSIDRDVDGYVAVNYKYSEKL